MIYTYVRERKGHEKQLPASMARLYESNVQQYPQADSCVKYVRFLYSVLSIINEKNILTWNRSTHS